MEPLKALGELGSETQLLDKYQKLRIKIRNHLQQSAGQSSARQIVNKAAEYVVLLPDLFHLTIKLAFDSTVPLKNKAVLVVALGYVLSPIDILPDIIPVIGQLDDLLIVTKALNRLYNSQDPATLAAIEKHWAGEGELMSQLQQVLAAADQLLDKIPGNVLPKIDRWLDSKLA